MPPKPPRLNLTDLSHEDKDRLIDALFARLDAVEAKLGMNSANSSKPPSSDGLAKKTTSLRKSSGKPAGGQKGRKGTTLRQSDQPDDVIRHPLPGQCERCHALGRRRVAQQRGIGCRNPAATRSIAQWGKLATTGCVASSACNDS